MSKKIIALALAIVFIATAFTACKRGPELTKINGGEYPLATDRDGNTIVNDENKVAVLVTDREKEVLTYADGEDQTYWLQLSGDIVAEDYVQSALYKLGIPEGWTGTEYGRVIKDKTDDKCYIKFAKMKNLKEEESLESYLENVDLQDTLIADTFADEEAMQELIKKNPQYAQFAGCKYTIAKDQATITSKSLNCTIRIHKIVDKENNVIHYAENYYFVFDKVIYQVAYICENGEGYDGSFNFAQYIAGNFTFKGKK